MPQKIFYCRNKGDAPLMHHIYKLIFYAIKGEIQIELNQTKPYWFELKVQKWHQVNFWIMEVYQKLAGIEPDCIWSKPDITSTGQVLLNWFCSILAKFTDEQMEKMWLLQDSFNFCYASKNDEFIITAFNQFFILFTNGRSYLFQGSWVQGNYKLFANNIAECAMHLHWYIGGHGDEFPN